MDQPVVAANPQKIPVYRQIEQYILDLINSPGYAPGDRVPSERALAETSKFSWTFLFPERSSLPRTEHPAHPHRRPFQEGSAVPA